MGAIPLGFKGDLQQYANVIIDNVTATVDATFLTGQMGGTMPTSDVGPWANGDEWWFWNASLGQYVPSTQGTPVGAIILWGGTGVPINWLLCDGRAISRSLYSLLFQAVGTTWGVGDGQSTFNLPPGGSFFKGAPGLAPVNTRGGQDQVYLQLENMPTIRVQTYIHPTSVTGGSGASVNAVGNPDVGDPAFVPWPAVDQNLVPLGGARQPISVDPPYVTVNYIIKYT
jgi:microcystin-dependent protein